MSAPSSPASAISLRCASSKERMNSADSLTLSLGLGDAIESGEETLRLVDGDDLNAHGCRVVLLDLFTLAFTEQAVVDEEAGELVSNSLVYKRCCHGGVNAAGERADDAVATDLLTDLCDLLFDDVVGGPGGLQACHIVEEVLQGDLAVVGVFHLGCHCTPPSLRDSSTNAATDAPGVFASTSKPSGLRSRSHRETSTRSEWWGCR